MARKSFNRKDRARIFNAALGVCHLCEGKIGVAEAWEVEHVIPYALTHDDSDANLRPAHVKCHRIKTDSDVTAIAKVYRIAAKHDGSFKKAKSFQKPDGTNFNWSSGRYERQDRKTND